MKINKNELKQSAVLAMDTLVITKSSNPFYARLERRIETIIRASINHLSYELRFGILNGKEAIYLEKDGRIIIIERNPDIHKGPSSFHDIGADIWTCKRYKLCEFAYHNAEIIITQVKGTLAKRQTEDTNATSFICAH